MELIKVMTREERRETVDYVARKVIAKGDLIHDSRIRVYEMGFFYCTPQVIVLKQKADGPKGLALLENFHDSNSNPTGLDFMKSDIRTLYLGSYHGLDEIALHVPSKDCSFNDRSRVILASRIHPLLKKRGLLRKDHERYDAMLQYAKWRLQ